MRALATPQSFTSNWNLDAAHSIAEFKVKHMMIANVKGHFAKVSGVLTLDESDVTRSHVAALIEAASIETRGTQRDKHLKSADFCRMGRRSPLASGPICRCWSVSKEANEPRRNIVRCSQPQDSIYRKWLLLVPQ